MWVGIIQPVKMRPEQKRKKNGFACMLSWDIHHLLPVGPRLLGFLVFRITLNHWPAWLSSLRPAGDGAPQPPQSSELAPIQNLRCVPVCLSVSSSEPPFLSAYMHI